MYIIATGMEARLRLFSVGAIASLLCFGALLDDKTCRSLDVSASRTECALYPNMELPRDLVARK